MVVPNAKQVCIESTSFAWRQFAPSRKRRVVTRHCSRIVAMACADILPSVHCRAIVRASFPRRRKGGECRKSFCEAEESRQFALPRLIRPVRPSTDHQLVSQGARNYVHILLRIGHARRKRALTPPPPALARKYTELSRVWTPWISRNFRARRWVDRGSAATFQFSALDNSSSMSEIKILR